VVPGVVAIRRNAGWLTISALIGGGLNFLYALGLTWLLPVRDYAAFAGTQALLVVCGTAAAASAPWMLSQRLARNPPPAARRDAISFAVFLTLAQGLLAALLVGALAAAIGHGSLLLAAVAASAAFSIFAATTSAGYLQGRQRFARLAVLLAGEVGVKVVSGVLLVLAGAGVAGVVAGIALGAVAVTLAAAPPMLRDLEAGVRWLRDRGLWRLLLGLSGVQVGVVVLCNLDLVLGSLLARDSAGFAGYQVAVVLSRVPFYLASSLSVAVFTGLVSRKSRTSAAMGPMVGILIASTIVVGVSVATLPLPVARVFLPHSYPSTVESLVPYTAPAGALAALTNLGTTFFQAEGRFSAACMALAVGILALSVGGVAGLSLLGVRGLAYAALGAQLLTAILLLGLAARYWGLAVLPRPWPLAASVAALPLFVLRPLPAVWAAYSCVLCLAVGWQTLFRRHDAGDDQALPQGGRSPRVYLLTVGPISPPWNGADTNLGRALVNAEIGVSFTFLGQLGDTTRLAPEHRRIELSFATGIPTPREQLRILGRIAVEHGDYELVHMIATFGRSRLREELLWALPLIRNHPLVVTCPNGDYLPQGLLGRAREVVTVSAHTEQRLRGLGLERVRRIAPGVDLKTFRPQPAAEAQRRLGLEPRPYLLFAGHHDPGGGLDAALRLTGELRAEFPDLGLLTAMRSRPGREHARERERARALAADLGLEAGSVFDLGPFADIPRALQACRAVLFQPLRVGRKMDLPMVLLEALAFGRPIIVSPVDALPELADGSPAVTVCEPGDRAALEAAGRLLDSEAAFDQGSAAARRLAECRYSATAMADAYSQLYAQVLGREAAASAARELAEAVG